MISRSALVLGTSDLASRVRALVERRCPDTAVLAHGALEDPSALTKKAFDFHPDVLLCVDYPAMLGDDVLSSARLFAANLHRGLLPFNRGRQPHRWPFLDGSPAGVTLHVLDEGEESGPVLCQTEVEIRASDDAASLHRRLDDAAVAMLDARWDHLATTTPAPQRAGGSRHTRSDVLGLRADRADIRALNLLRALQDDDGALIGDGAERVRVRLVIDGPGERETRA